MIFQPGIFALLSICIITASMVIHAAFRGARIIRRWELKSGHEEQLIYERRTYFISATLSYALAFEIGSFFLFIFTADDIHTRFTGAMCAAGTFYVNRYGYPALFIKLLACILSGLWLIINFADNRACDYPLIRLKYVFLLFLAPLFAVESILEIYYLLNLKGDIITSCCGSLFGAATGSVGSEMAALPAKTAMAGFLVMLALVFSAGTLYLAKRSAKACAFFSLAAVTAFPASVLALISFISLYFYELPTHHCPFCILQREYGHVGYIIYAALLTGAISGAGASILIPFTKVRSLAQNLPAFQRRLVVTCLASYGLFACISGIQMARSTLRLLHG